MGQYVVTDRWTTFSGSIEPSDHAYAIDQAHSDKMKRLNIDGAGCQICIFVGIIGGEGDTVHFETVSGYVEEHPVDSKGWAHTSMYNPGSGYDPKKEKGPWWVRVKDHPSDIADDIGLPGGEHVSTWVEFTWKDDITPPPVEPPVEPGPSDSTIQVAVKIGDATYQGTLNKV